MKTFIIALFCIATAFADVSELLHQPVPHHLEEHHQQDAHLIEPHHSSTTGHHSEAIHVEKHITFDFGLENEGVEIVEAIEVLPVGHVDVKGVQLTEEHKDYQAPYSYEKPTVQLDYVAPIVAEPTPEVETPIFKDQPISNNYLPPKYTQDHPAKRHVKYIVRRRV
ncbi:AAEL017372-PA [Aedes aegypti]|uniref:AAEL017372-PA n=1 Tax=Aedes aegypti TaxID=7159 RepID=J9HYD4_AEDAE|nr:AAEL017372-PA [Aedes aegypti]